MVSVALFVNFAVGLTSDNSFFLGEAVYLLWVVVASITLMIRAGQPSAKTHTEGAALGASVPA